jgi:hypothetical protein
MSHFDRVDPITQARKTGFDQILTSWFLDPHAKSYLSISTTKTFSWEEVKLSLASGVFLHENFSYLPLFYKGRIPSPTCKEVCLSFRKLNKPNWKYGYVMIRELIEKNPS